MPELPEVESVARSLRPRLVGRTVERIETSGLSLRQPIDRARLEAACVGARVDGVVRVGKYLLVELSRGEVLLAHLGMSGHFAFSDGDTRREPHTHLVLALNGGDELRYVDARRFGLLVVHRSDAILRSPELAGLGPDPLSQTFTPDYLAACLAESRGVAVKNFLLDQRRIAGLGNIYVSEALHVAGISPRRLACNVDAGRAERLHRAIVAVLSSSVERRGTTFRNYVDADGAIGENQHHLTVYGRDGEPCRACQTPIRRIVQGARSTFFCPRCQR